MDLMLSADPRVLMLGLVVVAAAVVIWLLPAEQRLKGLVEIRQLAGRVCRRFGRGPRS